MDTGVRVAAVVSVAVAGAATARFLWTVARLHAADARTRLVCAGVSATAWPMVAWLWVARRMPGGAHASVMVDREGHLCVRMDDD